MKKLMVVFLAHLIANLNLVSALETRIALGRQSVGTTLGYDNILNGSLPVLELNVSNTNGIIPIRAKVKYLATVWGRSNSIPVWINTSFVVYDEGNEANALVRSPNGARAVAHAQTREVQAVNGTAMLFVDEATFKLDRYLPPGRYQVFAYIDISGSLVKISEVLPRGTYWGTPQANIDGTSIVGEGGTIDKTRSTAFSLEVVPLTQRAGLTIEPKLSISRAADSVQVSWNSVFPDFNLESQEVGSSTWTPISRPGSKEVVVRNTNPYIGNSYDFQATVPTDANAVLFRLVPGGLVEATGEDMFWPVTQR